jgi:pimeloyl-ACP methyl ester carboxylesterase
VRGERLNDGLSAVTMGHGPPLVVLPGLGQYADLAAGVPRAVAWPNLLLATGLKRTVHVIHRPLRPPPGLTIAQLAGWHATALRERFGGPVDVMGVSGGGITALQLALDHPGAVRRLAILVAASRVSEQGRRDLLRLAELNGGRWSAAWQGSGLAAHGPLRLPLFAGYALRPGQPWPAGETALVRAAQDWDVTCRLAEIRVPALLVGGTRDPIIPPELVRATAAGIPGARVLLLPGRGHHSALRDRRVKPAIDALLAAPAPADGGQG